MQKADQPEPKRQIIWVLYWLVGSLSGVFLAGCFLDAGIVLAFPVIALISIIAWVALTVQGTRTALRLQSGFFRVAATASASFLAILLTFIAIWPVIWASGFVQAEVVLAFNIGDYRRQIEQSAARGSIREPQMWSYGGWLSIDRVIAYWPAGNPSRRLMTNTGGGASASFRWLRPSFYDCTIDY